jgi:hypothetical protein
VSRPNVSRIWIVLAAMALLGTAAPPALSQPAAAPAVVEAAVPALAEPGLSAAPAAAAEPTSQSGVVRLVVNQRRPFAPGHSFGEVGPYERLDATAYFEEDPRDPHNAVIVDLDRAPRNPRGMVEFSTPVLMLKPVDMSRGNHKLWYGANNRGNVVELPYQSLPIAYPFSNDPLTATDIGANNLLLRQGYSFVDAGWQGDVVPVQNRLAPTLPVATQPDGSPIVDRVRIEYSDRTIPQSGTFTLTLEGNPAFRSYETAVTNTAASTLTVRDSPDGPRTPIPSNRWAFGTCPSGQGSLVPTTTDICLFDGFRADKLYELIYPAKNPMPMGLGYAATRDLGSFLRYATHDQAGNPNPLALSATDTGIRRSYGSGTSSTGMYMRDWLYLGFNEDTAARKVFDAVLVNVAGTHRLFANVEFADPNTYSRQDDRHDFLSASVAPLTYAVSTDPISGISDGILKRPATDPLVFQVDSANEFWQMQGSLNVADGRGNPVPLPPTVRLYFYSSNSHLGSSGLFSPPGPPATCQYAVHNIGAPGLSSLNGHTSTVRALALALDQWANRGIEPPASNYPRLENGTLVPLEQARAAFPAIPGVQFPTVLNSLEVRNFGPEFNSTGGRLTILPPLRGPSYQLFVARPDSDGLDVAGVRPMDIRAPLGTNAGWNVRAPGSRAPNLCGLNGSFFPFARTRAERLASGDPRPSLEERYGGHAGFVQAVMRAAHELVQQRFLLPEDGDLYAAQAEASDVLR